MSFGMIALAATFLEELKETALEGELELRVQRRRNGHCDYCDRSPREPSCKFPTRHHDVRIEVR